MSRTVRRPMPVPSECSGDRCEFANCTRCARDAHFDLNGERSDKFAGHELNLQRECPGARRAHRRQHRRQINRTVATMATNREVWEGASEVRHDARRTSGWLTH
jgi:hypothetical protein